MSLQALSGKKLSKGGKTSTEVRSPTKTSTETSTDAYTAGNVTVTGGAGSGAHTTVHIHQRKLPEDPDGSKRSKGKVGILGRRFLKKEN
jgi:hypothetical protein